MKESIGLTATINIIMIFLVIAFIFLVAIISYAKAFKAASVIVKEIERFEGYNGSAYKVIDSDLSTLGYVTIPSNRESKCEDTRKAGNMVGTRVKINDVANGVRERYDYCVYYFNNDGDGKHYSYGVITYMTIDLYMFDMKLELPVYVRTRRIYRFG